MWLDWLVFCDGSFQSVCPLMQKDRRLIKAFWWDRLTEGGTGSFLMGRTMLSKSLIQFSVDGWSCVPFLLFTWGQTMVKVMKTMVTSLQRSHPFTATVLAPDPAAGHHQPTPSSETPRHPQTSLSSGHCSFLLGLGAQCSVVPSKSLVLCKFWWLYSGVFGDLLQEDLCHTHTQSPHLCSRPLPTCTSRGDAQSLWSSFNKTRLPLKCSVETDNSFSFDLNS